MVQFTGIIKYPNQNDAFLGGGTFSRNKSLWVKILAPICSLSVFPLLRRGRLLSVVIAPIPSPISPIPQTAAEDICYSGSKVGW